MSTEMLSRGSRMAERLRMRKSIQIQAMAAGSTGLLLTRNQLWSPEDAAAVGGWEALSSRRCLSADYLKSRLLIWKHLEKQAAELQDEEQWFHVCEIWEAKDECALVGWEHYLARETGQVPLFAEVIYA